MKGTLLALALLVLPQSALAQPPTEGTTHTFVDPVFTGTVFCDTYFEVLAIATAIEPVEVYREFLVKPNHLDEPTCAAIVPTAQVLDVRPLGIMIRDGDHYDAWAVEVRVGSQTGFALYIEHMELA